MDLHTFTPLITLYQAMDEAWDDAATRYGFQCTGCEDNCCLSLFFHHTHVEKAYLIYGFSQLSESERDAALDRAKAYCQATFIKGMPPVSQKQPCPLLFDGKCGVYPYRPMICRMHGLPHELHIPGRPTVKGPGCHAGNFQDASAHPLDRTPFYRRMAEVESRFRNHRRIGNKIKQSIAQMLLDPVIEGATS